SLIERAQPYWIDNFHAEFHPLWILHRISIIDKHQQIPIHGILLGNISFGGGAPLPPFDWTSELASASEFGAELRLIPDDPSVDVQGSATAYVVVHEPPGHEAALVTTLALALDDVRRVAAEAEATCFT